MNLSRTYRELLVWRKATSLALLTYRATERLPRSELFGLTSQMRRAAVSVPSNIAEGQGRMTRGEFRQFPGHARGSLLELETQLAIARGLGYLDEPNYSELDRQTHEVLGLLNRLLQSMSGQQATRNLKLET
jgi:four helix bundle protein